MAALVADARNNRIQVLDKKGDFLRDFGIEELGRTMNMAIADGKLYGSDHFKGVNHGFMLFGELRTKPSS